MRLKALARFFMKRPKGDRGYREDDPGFTDEQLSRMTEVTGVERIVVTEFANYQVFAMERYFDDPATQKLIQVIEEEMGRKVTYDMAKKSRETAYIELTKEFNAKDIKGASYFSLEARKDIGDVNYEVFWSEETGAAYTFDKASVKNGIGSPGAGPHSRVFCDQEVKAGLEAMKFAGLRFEECDLIGRSKKDIRLFELHSDIVLPRCSNSLVGDKRAPLSEYAAEGTCLIWEDSYPRQLVYTEEAFASFPEFDVAITYETLGMNVPDAHPSKYRSPMLVVSPRFRDWCKQQKYRKLDFIPLKEVE